MREAAPRPRERWGVSVITLHWATVALVVLLVDTGWQLVAHAAHIGQRTAVLRLHGSFGILLLAITLVRILVRTIATAPSGSTDGRLRRVGARVVQAALYLALLALVATGVVAAAPRPFAPAVELFGAWPLPKIPGLPPALVRSMPTIHSALVWLLFAIAGLHIAAAIHGTLIGGDRTILRMLPWPRRAGENGRTTR